MSIRATMRVGPISHYELAALRISAFGVLKGWGSIGDDGKWAAWSWGQLEKHTDTLVEWALTEGISDLPVSIVTPMVDADLYGEEK